MAEWRELGPADQIENGSMRGFDLDGRRVLVARVEGRLHAIGGICTHAEAYLEEGELSSREVACPLHFATFDLVNGAATSPPAFEPVAVFLVKEEGGTIWIGLD